MIQLNNLLVGLVARLPVRVQTKLLAAFLAIAALLIALGAVGLYTLSGVNQRTEELIRSERKIAAYRQVQHDTTSQLYSISSALLVSDERTLDSALRQLNQFGYDLERLQFVAKDEIKLLGKVRQEYDRFIAVVTRVVELIRGGHVDEAREAQMKEARPLASRLERLTNELVNKAEADVVAGIEASGEAYRTSRMIVVATPQIWYRDLAEPSGSTLSRFPVIWDRPLTRVQTPETTSEPPTQTAATPPPRALESPGVETPREKILKPQISRRSCTVTIAVGLMTVCVSVLTILHLIDRQSASRPEPMAQVGSVPPPTAARREALRYYLELEPSGGSPTQATGFEPLDAGRRFKFHFTPREGGYLYLIALGKGNTLKTFLTAQPLSASGVKTNQVAAGRDFQFPGGDAWLVIEREADATPFTIIFSPSPLETPRFLAAPAGRSLTADEQNELAAWRERFKAAAPELAPQESNHQSKVAVSRPAERSINGPLIFDILIKRK